MVIVQTRQATYAGGIHSLESIPGLHKRLKIRALYFRSAEKPDSGTEAGGQVQQGRPPQEEQPLGR